MNPPVPYTPKFMLQDARTKEIREIEPGRLGSAKMADYEGRTLVHLEVKTGTTSEFVPLDNPASNIVEQMYLLLPGSEAITLFSPDPQTGLVRRALSWMQNGLKWSPDRIDAFLKFMVEEAKQLRPTSGYVVKQGKPQSQ